MVRGLREFFLLVAVVLRGSGVPIGADHTVMGTVTMAAADHVMLKDKDGKDVTILVTMDKDQMTAKFIEVGAAAAGK